MLGATLVSLSGLGDDVFLHVNGEPVRLWRPDGWAIEGQTVMLVVGAPLAAVETVLMSRRQARIETRNRELEAAAAENEERYEAAATAMVAHGNNMMFRMATEMGLGVTERATLVVAEDDHFRLVGRYSRNPAYEAPGRGVYPLREGCLAQAWEEEEHEVAGLPDPASEWDNYARRMAADYAMSEADVRALSMRSRSYAARRLTDASRQFPRGVVIIESTDPGGVSLASLDGYLDEEHANELSQGLVMLRHVRTGQDVAKEAGY